MCVSLDLYSSQEEQARPVMTMLFATLERCCDDTNHQDR